MHCSLYIAFLSCKESTDKTFAEELACEYIPNPPGIDILQPRLKWKKNTTNEAFYLSPYRMLVGSDSAESANGNVHKWNTKKISSPDVIVMYGQKPMIAIEQKTEIEYFLTSNNIGFRREFEQG